MLIARTGLIRTLGANYLLSAIILVEIDIEEKGNSADVHWGSRLGLRGRLDLSISLAMRRAPAEHLKIRVAFNKLMKLLRLLRLLKNVMNYAVCKGIAARLAAGL
jgi:hypothetical protein